MRNSVEEMSGNDYHFRKVLDYFDSLNDEREKAQAGAIITLRPTTDRNRVIHALQDMDYEEITGTEDDLGIGDERI
jgi:hypothetical protein